MVAVLPKPFIQKDRSENNQQGACLFHSKCMRTHLTCFHELENVATYTNKTSLVNVIQAVHFAKISKSFSNYCHHRTYHHDILSNPNQEKTSFHKDISLSTGHGIAIAMLRMSYCKDESLSVNKGYNNASLFCLHQPQRVQIAITCIRNISYKE